MRDKKRKCVGLLGGIVIAVSKKLTVERGFQTYHFPFDTNNALKSEFRKKEIS
jgi:hypothetical protein